MEIENGAADYNTDILTSVLRYPVNTEVSFSCDAGYYSSHFFSSATCQNSGKWSQQVHCLGNENEFLSSMSLTFFFKVLCHCYPFWSPLFFCVSKPEWVALFKLG